MSERYAAMFARLRAAREGAFGAFVMLGDPDLGTGARILSAFVEGGADMIEVGLPFSDPVADGPVIQAASMRALAAGVRTADALALVADLRREHPDTPVGVLTYANLVLARGRRDFYQRCAAVGVDSVLVADAPLLEIEPFALEADRCGIATVLIAAANTPRNRITAIARRGRGYTYCVARAGVTGVGEQGPRTRPARTFNSAKLFETLSQEGAPPPVLGFGIATPEHVRAALASGAAGVISGSAIVSLIAAGGDDVPAAVRTFVRAMKDATI